MLQLVTERLILRSLDDNDINSVYEIFKDKEVTQYSRNIPYPYTKNEAGIFVKHAKFLLKVNKSYELAIILKETKKFVGVTAMMDINPVHKNAGVSYFLGKDYWNMGIATEAARRVVNYGFEHLELERISAECFADNTASAKVLKKLGFTLEGCFRREVLRDGVFFDMLQFAILRSEWLELLKKEQPSYLSWALEKLNSK